MSSIYTRSFLSFFYLFSCLCVYVRTYVHVRQNDATPIFVWKCERIPLIFHCHLYRVRHKSCLLIKKKTHRNVHYCYAQLAISIQFVTSCDNDRSHLVYVRTHTHIHIHKGHNFHTIHEGTNRHTHKKVTKILYKYLKWWRSHAKKKQGIKKKVMKLLWTISCTCACTTQLLWKKKRFFALMTLLSLELLHAKCTSILIVSPNFWIKRAYVSGYILQWMQKKKGKQNNLNIKFFEKHFKHTLLRKR